MSSQISWTEILEQKEETYVLLLVENLSDLEPNVGFREGTRWIAQNVTEAVQGGC